MLDVIRQHLNHAKQRMKKYADQHRSERHFEVNDWVFVKLQPYIQSSLSQRANQKLAFKYFGPYRVVARVGTMAYQLELPASSSVHLVFHVPQLKKFVGAQQTVTTHPPSADVIWSIPERILQIRSVLKGTHSISQGLIKWSHLPVSLATWETLDHLRQQFPHAAVWSRLGAQGGEDVTAHDMNPCKSAAAHGPGPASEEEATAQGPGPHLRRSSRAKVPSTRTSGDEWASA